MFLYGETIDRLWMQIQFWAGVSFGYLVMAHVAADRLNWIIIGFISALYIAFTAQSFQMMDFHMDYVLEYKKSIFQLYEAGALQTPAAKLAAVSKIYSAPFLISILGTFFAALIYLPYKHWQQVRS